MTENGGGMSVNELAVQAKHGDKAAMERLIAAPEIKRVIYKTANEKVGPEHAEDIYQRVCVTIWKKLNTWQGQAKITSWVGRVTHNDCIDFLRSTKPHKLIFTPELPVDLVEAHQNQYILDQERYRILTHALSELEELCQQLLQRFLFEGEDKKSIMQSVQLKKSTFYERFNNCCAHLQRYIQKRL